jgi:hypothetical protein
MSSPEKSVKACEYCDALFIEFPQLEPWFDVWLLHSFEVWFEHSFCVWLDVWL